MSQTRVVVLVSLLFLGLAGCAAPALPITPPRLRWVEGRVLVKFHGEADPVRMRAARARIGTRISERLPLVGAEVLSLDGTFDVMSALERLSDYSDVIDYAEPDFVFEADGAPSEFDPNVLWGLAKIGAPQAWPITQGSRQVVVAILDTGIDGENPDLAANLWTNPGETADGLDEDGDGFVDDVHGWNFVDGTPDPIDDVSHGTHVAGTIGAVGGNGGVVGVSPKVSLMALKTLGPAGGRASDAIRAIAFAANHGARVINASWGGRGYSNGLKNAIEKAGAAGVLFVAAAGNGDEYGVGQDADRSPSYPAAFGLPNVISVAATDENDRLASFSNYGPVTVDLAAPGVGIVSTVPHGRLARYDGTSMATPHVTGTAALILSEFPDMPVSQLKALILDSASPVPALRGRIVSGGRLDAASAVESARAARVAGTPGAQSAAAPAAKSPPT